MVPQWPRKNLIGIDFFCLCSKVSSKEGKKKTALPAAEPLEQHAPCVHSPVLPDTLLSRAEGRKVTYPKILPGPADTTLLLNLQAAQ